MVRSFTGNNEYLTICDARDHFHGLRRTNVASSKNQARNHIIQMQGWLMEQSGASSVLTVVENSMEQEQYIRSEHQIWLGL